MQGESGGSKKEWMITDQGHFGGLSQAGGMS